MEGIGRDPRRVRLLCLAIRQPPHAVLGERRVGAFSSGLRLMPEFPPVREEIRDYHRSSIFAASAYEIRRSKCPANYHENLNGNQKISQNSVGRFTEVFSLQMMIRRFHRDTRLISKNFIQIFSRRRDLYNYTAWGLILIKSLEK